MNRRLTKVMALFFIVLLLVTDLRPLANDGEWFSGFSSWLETVFAADPDDGGIADTDYQMFVGQNPVANGTTVQYDKFVNGWEPLKILLKSNSITSGASISWTVTNENVVQIAEVGADGDPLAVKLNIKSPGYSGLTATVTDAQGNVLSAVAYCTLYIPLVWSDDVSNTDPTQNNIKAKENPGKYGLLYAQDGNTFYTLQIHTESEKYPDYWHYIRKLKYIRYNYNAASGKTGAITSDAKAEDIDLIEAAIKWDTSDPSIVDVDALTGMITAKSAGYAEITVSTTTVDSRTGKGDSLTFGVVVAPDATVTGYTTVPESVFSVVTDSTDSDIVIQTNANFATTLNWKVYAGEAAATSKDITNKLGEKFQVSPATGRVVLSGLAAGTYCITGIPVKPAPTYNDVTNGNITFIKLVIVVPFRFPASPILLNIYNANVRDSFDLLDGTNLPTGVFNFSTEDPTIATVDKNGILEARGEGKTRVHITSTLTSNSKREELFGKTYASSPAAIGFDWNNVVIDVEVIDGIQISSTAQTLALGATYQLNLTAPSPFDGKITWTSSDEKVVKVDEAGLITAVGTGDAVVRVKIRVKNGVYKRAECKIKVVNSVEAITLNAKHNWVAVGDNLTISATISPKLTNTNLTWHCSDESIAAISDVSALSMTITGVKSGTVVITAVNQENAVVGTLIIDVIQDITAISLSDTEITLPVTQKFYQLYAYCTPKLPENQKLTWSSSNKKVVTVDSNGKVTLVKPGQAVITVVTENGLIATCTVTVTQGVTGIVLDDPTLELYVGESHRMTYVIKPANASEITLKWTTSDSKIATVDSTGYITAKNVGTCVITAQTTDGTGIFVMATITVYRKATSMKLDVTALTLDVGESYTLEPALTPADSSDPVTYESSNSKIATVNSRGKVTGRAKGKAIIMAKTASGLTAYCDVDVVQQVTGITLSVNNATIEVGEELELEAVITPKNASDAEVTWTSENPQVCTVNKNGKVVGVSGGYTLVKAVTNDGGYMAYAMITVIEKVTSITVDPTYVEIGIGEKLKLNAVINNEKATNKNVKWKSSKSSVVYVNSKGVIKGRKVGKATITVSALDGSGETAEVEVRVITKTESIEVSTSYVTLIEGQTHRITATTYPGTTTYKPVFSSENEKVALVNKNGTITAVKAGNTVITVAAGDDPTVTAVVYVNVIAPVNATNVSFAESEVIMTVGETKAVPFSITPANFTESYTWSSDNPNCVTVDPESGRFVANAVGTANITLMTRSGRKGSVKVFVVGLSRTDITLHQYESLQIKLEVDGNGSQNLKVRWDTDNQGIAEITNGKVTAKALGTTKVYAVVNGRRLACNVKVIKNK